MKIRFDNEDELRDLAFVISRSDLEVCPGELGLMEKEVCGNNVRRCIECWENALRSVSTNSLIKEMLNAGRKER